MKHIIYLFLHNQLIKHRQRPFFPIISSCVNGIFTGFFVLSLSSCFRESKKREKTLSTLFPISNLSAAFFINGKQRRNLRDYFIEITTTHHYHIFFLKGVSPFEKNNFYSSQKKKVFGWVAQHKKRRQYCCSFFIVG